MIKNSNTYISIDIEYPIIPDELIERLKIDYPNKLPDHYIDDYEQGIIRGQQIVIEKLTEERAWQLQGRTEEG